MQTPTGEANTTTTVPADSHTALDDLREEVARMRATLELQRCDIRDLKKEVRRLSQGLEGQAEGEEGKTAGRSAKPRRPTSRRKGGASATTAEKVSAKPRRPTPRRKGGASAPPAEEEGWVEPPKGAGNQSAEAKKRALERKQEFERERRRARRLAKKKGEGAGPSTAEKGTPAAATPQKRVAGDRGGTTENWKRQKRDQFGRFISSRGEGSTPPAAEKGRASGTPEGESARKAPEEPTELPATGSPEATPLPAVLLLPWHEPSSPPPQAEAEQAAPPSPQPQQPPAAHAEPCRQGPSSSDSFDRLLASTSSEDSVDLPCSSNSAASSRSPSP